MMSNKYRQAIIAVVLLVLVSVPYSTPMLSLSPLTEMHREEGYGVYEYTPTPTTKYREAGSVVLNGSYGAIEFLASLSRDVFYPGLRNWVVISINNTANTSLSNLKLLVKAPYFLVPGGTIEFINGTGTYNISFGFLEYVTIGIINASSNATIRIPLMGALGIDDSGSLSISLFNGTVEMWSPSFVVYSSPSFVIEVNASKQVVDISKENNVTLYILLRNVYPISGESGGLLSIYNLVINISSTPSTNITPNQIVVRELNNTVELRYEVRAEVTEMGFYEFVLEGKADVAYLHNESRWLNYTNIFVARKVVITSTGRLIIFDDGHNQYYRFSSEGMQGFIDVLSDVGPVLINHGEFAAELLNPNVTALVVIPNPETSDTIIFTDDEISALQNYVENGGTLLLMGNYYKYFYPQADINGFDALTGKYGLYWIDGDVYDPVNNYGANWSVKAIIVPNNKYAKTFFAGVTEVRFAGTALNITMNNTESPRVVAYPLLIGNNESYVTEGTESDPRIVNGTDVVMAALLEVENGTILAFGSSYMFSDYYYFSDNKRYISNMVYWLFQVTKLDVSITSDLTAKVGQDFKIYINISNIGVSTIEGITISVTVPTGLKLKNSTTIVVGDLEPGVIWSGVIVVTADTEGSYPVNIVVSASNYEETFSQIIMANFVGAGGVNVFLVVGVIVLLVVVGVFVYLKRDLILSKIKSSHKE